MNTLPSKSLVGILRRRRWLLLSGIVLATLVGAFSLLPQSKAVEDKKPGDSKPIKVARLNPQKGAADTIELTVKFDGWDDDQRLANTPELQDPFATPQFQPGQRPIVFRRRPIVIPRGGVPGPAMPVPAAPIPAAPARR